VATPFDATTKALLEYDPLAWVHLFGLPGDEAEIIDADLATITASADRVIRVLGERPYLLHVEFQASYDPEMGRRLLRYNVMLNYRHNQPVQSVLVLLRPEAGGRRVNGRLGLTGFDGQRYLAFRYATFRVWESSTESLLAAPPSLAPLAVLGRVSAGELPEVARRFHERVRNVRTDRRGELRTAAFVLAGLRFPPDLITNALRRIPEMRESSTYQLLVAEGRAEGRAAGLQEGREEGREVGREEGREVGRMEELKRMLRLLGDRRFGTPDGSIVDRVESEQNLNILESWVLRLMEVESWKELFS
jgi:predicted transposase YdaD